MYIDYDSFNELDEALDSIKGREYSPGYVSRIYGVTRQSVQQWIAKDIINAHRCKGDGGHYVYIKESEFAKIDSFRLAHGRYQNK